MEYVLTALALAFGASVGWILARARASRIESALRAEIASAKESLAGLAVRVEERERALEEQKSFLEASRQTVQDAFARLSQEALAKNSQSILEATSERLLPLREALARLDAETHAIERGRAQAYGSLEKHLTDLSEATRSLRSSNEVLVTAFKGSMTARGRFGELQLKNLVEAAGMRAHCDFLEQPVVDDGSRPDMIIKLPEGDGLPVDAKVPLSSYWAACETTDPATRAAALQGHAEALRRHVRAVGKRDYSRFLSGRIDYAVLFVPSEPILSAAIETDPDVFEEALRLRVLIATPVTFFALLRTTRILWNQRALADNALAIQAQATELYNRVVTYHEHVARIGDHLGRASEAFNKAASSFQTRVLPSGRRLAELGGAADARKELDELPEVEIVRHVPTPAGEPANDA